MFGADEQVAGRRLSDTATTTTPKESAMNTLLKPLAIAALSIAMLNSANASWRLIPGKPYDGHYPVSRHKEPCWSAALSKCSFERNRQNYHEQAKKAPQR